LYCICIADDEPENEGPSIYGKLGAAQRQSRSPPGSAETADTKSGYSGSSQDGKPIPPLTINQETERLVEELQRRYSTPVLINDGIQQLPTSAAKETSSAFLASAIGRQQNIEQCE